MPGPLVRRAVALSVPLLAACGGSTDDAPAQREALTVWAVEERLAADLDEAPVARATIALDVPGEARVERTADETGRATFEADFSRGASLTVYSPDHVLVSVLGVTPAAASAQRASRATKRPTDFVVSLPRLDRAARERSVVLAGRIAGKRQATSSVDISVSGLARLGSLETTGETYSLRAPRGRPFFLLGYELAPLGNDAAIDNQLLAAFRLDLPARTADATLDLDVAAAASVPTRVVHLTARAPGGPSSPFGPGTRAYATVLSGASELLVGPVLHAGAGGVPGSFDLSMAVAETDAGSEPLVTRTVLVAPDGSRSLRTEPGVVADGAAQNDFVMPPTVPPGERKLADPLPLVGVPPDADLRVDVIAGNQVGWIIHAPHGPLRGDALRIPGPLEILFPDLLALTVSARLDPVEVAAGYDIHRRVGVSHDVVVRRR